MLRALYLLKEFLIIVPFLISALSAIRRYMNRGKSVEWLTLLAPIITNGLELLNEKQKTRIKDEYKDLLDKLRDFENRPIGEYTDYDIDMLKIEIRDFLKVYSEELKKVSNE